MARYERKGDGLEFERIAFFSDAVYAIAMTLLIVAIAVPSIAHSSDSHDMLDALGDKESEFVAFFVGFAVLGQYWVANHRFVNRLAAGSTRLLFWLLVYLASVAWLPFPTALIGRYGDNAVAVSLFAISAAIVSALETAMMAQAQHDRLYRREIPGDVFRFAVLASLVPVLFFLLSIPIAFFQTWIAIVMWFGAGPAEGLINRWKPPNFDQFWSDEPVSPR